MRILICNRGEIACRLIKTYKQMNYETVVIYSTADKNSQHVLLADYAVCVGGASAIDSYLNVTNILISATSLGCDAVHPGYGFLSEDYEFVRLLEELNILFIGPTSETIHLMGDKIRALKTVKSVLKKSQIHPFYVVSTPKELKKASKKLTFPVIIKHSAGGGGRGMRVAQQVEDVTNAFEQAYSEAKLVDPSPSFYMENYVKKAKHIEVQILADRYQNVIALSTRDCSMQRRGQKVIEQAPGFIDSKSEEMLETIAIKTAKKIKYVGLGTFEFLVKDQEIYFLEMNTRIQVEHTVTEELFGLDLVKLQTLVAMGENIKDLEYVKKPIFALECRINAEDPSNNFCASPGVITKLHLPALKNVRYDFGVIEGDTISPFYDSMVGKVIVTASTRLEVISYMIDILKQIEIVGIKTNISFLIELLKNRDFCLNTHHTDLIKELHEVS